MDDRLRGNGNYTIEQIMASSSYKEDWYALEQLWLKIIHYKK